MDILASEANTPLKVVMEDLVETGIASASKVPNIVTGCGSQTDRVTSLETLSCGNSATCFES